MAKGETHAYLLTLPAGCFADLAVDQQGVDVKVVVYGPDGRALATSDRFFGSRGVEPVPIIAERPGRYRLEVRPSGTLEPSGKYQVRLVALRPATPGDRDRVAAEELFARGGDLRQRGDHQSLAAAVSAFQQAREGFRVLGERGREADILDSLARASLSLGKTDDAIAFDRQALALNQSLGREREVERIWIELGRAYQYRGERHQALDCYRQALELSQRLDDRWAQAASLQNLGMVYHWLGETGQAIDHYKQALELWRLLGNRSDKAKTGANLGDLYQSIGETQQALDRLEPALALFVAERNAGEEARTLNSIGVAYSRNGRQQKAIETLERALLVERRIGDPSREALTLNDLGCVYFLLGDRRQARTYFAHARALYRQLDDRPAEAVALANVAWADANAGRPQAAVESYGQALPLLAAFGDRTTEAAARLGLARARRSFGDLAGSLEAVERGIAQVESLRGTTASPAIRAAFQARNQEFYSFAVDLLMAMHRDAEALAAAERARARGLLDRLAESGFDLKRGVDPTLLARINEADRRVNEADRLRSQLQGSGAIPARLAAADRQLRQALSESDQAQTALRLASPGYAALHTALTHPRSLTVREIQEQVLDDDTVLLEYSLGNERSFLWAVTSEGLAARELPGRSVIEGAARSGYERLERSRETLAQMPAEEARTELSQLLLQPVTGLLGRKRLLIVPDGALHYLPFAALPVPGSSEPLVAGHEVVTSPSASALAVERRELAGRRPAPGVLAVVADPVFEASDPRVGRPAAVVAPAAWRGSSPVGGDRFQRLGYSRAEAEALKALVPPEERLDALDFKASRETVLSGALARYRIIHFATHGMLDTENPGLSKLVFSQVDEQGRPRNGFVWAHEIYGLSLPADLVVLSACHTALGQEIRGEGLVGLTRGFQYAGARAVLVSLWEVDDEATAELMRLFYSAMLKHGQPPAAALRTAQEALRHEDGWQAPYYWAGFVLQGDWRQRINQSAPPGSTHGRPEPRGLTRRMR